ncbi:MAG: transglycosylase domain-containing protein [Bacilli bacterium]
MKKMKKTKKLSKPNIKKGTVKTIILSGLLICGIGVVTLILIFALYVIITSPDFVTDKLYSKESTVLYYANGEEMSRFGDQNRVLISYDQVPQVLIDALIATEDSRYFQHTGLDVARFTKATIGQLTGNDKAGGASTITMQVIKQSYTSSEDRGLKGLIRKFTDVYMAIFKLERNYTKEEIIEFYLNSQWLGGDGSLNYSGISGIEQAANFYFGKSASDLSLAEASIIAGMFQNPRLYNPYKNEEGVTNRQNIVLTLMVKHGYITEEEKKAVQKIPVSSLLAEKKVTASNANQAVIDLVLDEVEAKTKLNPYRVPMKIYTTVDPSIQNVITELEKGTYYNFPNDVVQEGMAITSMEDGSIKAISGGRNYQAKGTNRALGRRQPGSTAKPILDYGPYIEYLNGSTYSMFLDEPSSYSDGTRVRNSDNRYTGLITMRNALSNSRNIPALTAFQRLQAADASYVPNFVHSLGIDYGKNLYESASIGGFDGISPLEMSAAYGAFGRGGYYIEPYIYTKIEIMENSEVIEHKFEKEKVMSEQTAYMITSMLVTAGKNGIGGTWVSGTELAAKTGTTTIDEQKTEALGIPATATMDQWVNVYSPEYSIATWIGYDKLSKEYYLTSNAGIKIKNGMMSAIGQKIFSKNKTFTKPTTVIECAVEIGTFPALLASDFTPSNLIVNELFKEGTEPTEVSTRFSKLNAPTGGSYTFDGTKVNLKWTNITTPDVANPTTLKEYFNNNYGAYASKYYEDRISYNNSYIGSLGYQVYKKETNGTLTLLGRTESNNFEVTNPTSGSNTYVIKTAYSLFKANLSDGLVINTKSDIDSNVDEIIKPPKPTTPTTPTKPDLE